MFLYTCISSIIVAILNCFLPERYVKPIDILLKTLPRDIMIGITAAKLLVHSFIYKQTNATAITQLNACVQKYPDKPCFIFENQIWTFQDVNVYSNKVANLFQRAGYKKGDVIALNVTNRPEYACIWLGLAKIGVISALINTNLKNKSLSHCISVASCKAIIFSSDLAEAVNEVRSSLDKDLRYYHLGPPAAAENTVNLDDALEVLPNTEPMKRNIGHRDHIVYVFTSGTTGLPKAAIVPHSRYLLASLFAQYIVGVTRDDVIYNPLPLYHTAGGLFGVCCAIGIGASVVIKKKFSASGYIEDCIKYKCTVGQYIGELCRYVLAVKERPIDKQHNLRLITGNGLRPSIWTKFVERFNIPNVIELYGSTEGNLQFANTDNKVGAVGVIPRFFPFSRYIGAIIRVDKDSMEPIRNSKGLCIECEIGEPGMFVGLIPKKDTVKEFHGYLDKKESGKKKIYNVFNVGDKAFMSGDLVVLDELGYLYFKDRTGDTFRWKGENVATSEVEDILSTIIGFRDCVVYGVQVGDSDGKAGMAAIADPSGKLDFSQLVISLDKFLPKYAQPIFIRVLPELEMTGTFKPKKITFANEGFDPSIVKDPLFVRNGITYVPLNKDLYTKIVSGSIKM